MSADWWGDEIRPLAELADGLGDFIGQTGSPAEGSVMTVDRLSIALPLEVRVATAAGAVSAVTVAAPERTATSFPPSIHQLKMRIVLDDAG